MPLHLQRWGAFAVTLASSACIANSTVADPPALPHLPPAVQAAFDSGYEHGAADALAGRDTSAALSTCERKRKQADDLVMEQVSDRDTASRYAHCLVEIRNAMPWGEERLKAAVRRCTAGLP
jgi:hypothetical protein